MAVIKIEARKDARSTQTICLIQGDRRTQILRFNVNRYDGGVDLMDLSWVIKTRNAAGVEDVYEPAAVEIGMTTITIDWLVDGSVTDASGMASYELNGLDATVEGKPVVWKGGTGTMSLRANIGENFGNIDMTNIDRLVLYVEGRLQYIVDLTDELEGAGDAANAAAAAANAGAERAEAAATAANAGAMAATESAANANAAAEAANTAALPHAQLYGMRVKGETAKASGNPVSFLPDAGSLLQPVTVLEPMQAGSGDPSPANIRPITGYDALDLNAAGKNLCPKFKAYEAQGITLTVADDGELTLNGTAAAAVNFNTDINPPIPPGTYALTANNNAATSNSSSYIVVRDAAGNNILDCNFSKADGGTSVKTTTAEGTVFRIRIAAGETLTNLKLRPQLEVGNKGSSFATPHNTAYTVQIGQTVYGGRMDWLTGKLIVDIGYKVLTGDESYTQGSSGILTVISDAATPVIGGIEAWCSHYKRTGSPSLSGIADGEFTVSHKSVSGTARLYIQDSVNCPDVSTGQAYIAAQYAAGTPVQVVYKLATPIEIQLTPHIISAVEPEQNNTLYGDGNIEVEYVKPLHVSIEERVAAAMAALATE